MPPIQRSRSSCRLSDRTEAQCRLSTARHRRYHSRRPRRQSPFLAARRSCAALLRRPTPQSPPARLHRHSGILRTTVLRSPPARRRSERSQVVLPQVFGAREGVSADIISSQLSPWASALFEFLPPFIRRELLLYPESNDSAQLSQIEIEKLLAFLVEVQMNKRLVYLSVRSHDLQS
nr:pyrophosphate--fructose 6-phosphate 1-phosphotransferase subunit alpha [Ipomoea batatas]GME11747.1 pyrophosphate--fructose 6-phosphate 1-phosphotransferase subunit alpha [Ipomoea batatas]